MNSELELYKRMLESFPVNLLKNHFESEGNKSEVIELIANKFLTSDIDNFVCESFGYLHQRVFIREVNKGSLLSQSNLMQGKLLDYKLKGKSAVWFYYHKAIFQYFDTKTTKNEYIEFYVPIKLEHNGIKLVISYNTFARDIRTYFDSTIFPLPSGNIEDSIFNDLKSNCSQIIFKLDLNKGVKYLWDKDIIDGLVVKNRQSKSIRQDRMDEDFMYKKSYPKEWIELMKTPIEKTKFKIINNSNLKHFECNPSSGFIGITVHSDNEQEVSELISLILKHN